MSHFMRHGVEIVAALTLGFIVAHCSEGCAPAQSANGQVEAAYTAELLACVEKAHTKQEADDCRREVNRRYGLCDQVKWPRVTPCD